MPGILKPCLLDITTLPSWVYCFLAYTAIRSPDPATREMLAYARLVIRESQRHGGNGWLEYDRVFRQQAALDHTMRWNTLHPGIQAETLVGHAPTHRLFCTLCREPDHTADQCALAYLQAFTAPLIPVTPVPTSNSALRPRPPKKTPRVPPRHLCVLEQVQVYLPQLMFLKAYLCNLPPGSHGPHLYNHPIQLRIQVGQSLFDLQTARFPPKVTSSVTLTHELYIENLNHWWAYLLRGCLLYIIAIDPLTQSCYDYYYHYDIIILTVKVLSLLTCMSWPNIN